MKKWLNKDKFRKIEVLTVLLLLAHIGLLVSRSNNAAAPLTWQYVTDNVLQNRVSFAYRSIVEIPLVYSAIALVVLFVLLLLAKLRIFRKAVAADNKAEVSRFRWYEVGLGGSFLAVFATQLSGGYNPAIHVAILAAGVIFAMNGTRIEMQRAQGQVVPKQTTWTALLSAKIILVFLAQQVLAMFLNNSSVSVYIYGIAGVVAAYWLLHGLLIWTSLRVRKEGKKRRRKPMSFLGRSLAHRLVTIAAVAAVVWQTVLLVG